MPEHLRGSSFSFISCLAISFCLGLNNAVAAKPAKVLQGSVKHEASLRPSLKVLPGQERRQPRDGTARQDFFPLNTGVDQFKGSVSGFAGQLPQLLRNAPPHYDKRIWGIIPPISTYTLRPRNSVLWVAPGFEVTRQFNSFVPTSSGRGVTSWEPGYGVTRVKEVDRNVRLPVSVKGVTAWEPGYEVARVRTIAPSLSPAPMLDLRNKLLSTSTTAQLPGYKASASALKTRRGVICWAPGYEVSVQTPGLIKESLGGMWYAPSYPRNVSSVKTFLEAVPAPSGMVAAPLLLPELRPGAADKNLDWDSWYKRIAKAIYSRWQYADVGPGFAVVRVNITTARDLSCRLVDFTPAEDMDRNVVAETAFREAAVKAVNSVRTFEIPELPPMQGHNRVTFDVEMKRTIDGPIGIDVALVQPGNRKTGLSTISN